MNHCITANQVWFNRFSEQKDFVTQIEVVEPESI